LEFLRTSLSTVAPAVSEPRPVGVATGSSRKLQIDQVATTTPRMLLAPDQCRSVLTRGSAVTSSHSFSTRASFESFTRSMSFELFRQARSLRPPGFPTSPRPEAYARNMLRNAPACHERRAHDSLPAKGRSVAEARAHGRVHDP